jgi:hypothetical protein
MILPLCRAPDVSALMPASTLPIFSRPTARVLIAACLATCSHNLWAAEPKVGVTDLSEISLQADTTQKIGQVTWVWKGFTLSGADWHLIGDALRWEEEEPNAQGFRTEHIYAIGNVVYVQDGLRVEAHRLGFRIQRPVTPEAKARQRDSLKTQAGLPVELDAQDVRVLLKIPEPKKDLLDDSLDPNTQVLSIKTELSHWSPQGRFMRLTAPSLHMTKEEIRLTEVAIDAGHGGTFGLKAGTVVIGLREEQAPDRNGIARRAKDIYAGNLQLTAASVPVFWLPALYRDYRLNYPWTKYEFESSRRLGYGVRAWIGFDVPTSCDCKDEANGAKARWYDWHLRVLGRGDWYQNAGSGQGAELRWANHDLGKGRFLWFGMDETVFAPRSEEYALQQGPITQGRKDVISLYTGRNPEPVAERNATVFDMEHRASFTGGGVSLRYTVLPDADPITPDPTDPALSRERRSANERFRDDFLAQDLNTRPAARQGAAVTWSFPGMTLTADTDQNPNRYMDATERDLGLFLRIPSISLLGPINWGGKADWEILRNDGIQQNYPGHYWTETSAERLLWRSHLGLNQWIGPIGLDARGGVDGLSYTNYRSETWQRHDPTAPLPPPGSHLRTDRDGLAIRIAEVENSSQGIMVPTFDAGLSTRFEGRFGDSTLHSVTPRIGVEVRGVSEGADVEDPKFWHPVNFGDSRDTLIEDVRYLTTGFSTQASTGTLNWLTADFTARWGLTEKERRYTVQLEDGTVENLISPKRLVDITGAITASPYHTLEFTANGLWDARDEKFKNLTGHALWWVTERIRTEWTATYVPSNLQPIQERDPITGLFSVRYVEMGDNWQQSFLTAWRLNRYELSAQGFFKPQGRSLDGMNLGIRRLIAEGSLGMWWHIERDPKGNILDKGFTFGVNLLGAGIYAF